METENPWLVESIQAFYVLKCPECAFDSEREDVFQYHAVENHPLSFVLFGKELKYEQFEAPQFDAFDVLNDNWTEPDDPLGTVKNLESESFKIKEEVLDTEEYNKNGIVKEEHCENANNDLVDTGQVFSKENENETSNSHKTRLIEKLSASRRRENMTL